MSGRLPTGSDPSVEANWKTITLTNGTANYAAMTDTALYAFGSDRSPDSTSVLRIWSFVAP